MEPQLGVHSEATEILPSWQQGGLHIAAKGSEWLIWADLVKGGLFLPPT